MKLGFYGAAGGVTGSHTIISDGSFRIGIDAGLFQGLEHDRNELGLGYDPASLRALMLTHAHIDHSGRIPYLVKGGFHGPVYSTPATAELCGIMLRDSAHLMDEEALHQGRHSAQEDGPPPTPLYSPGDVVRALRLFRTIGYSRELATSDFSAIFRDAGHILGSATIEVTWDKRKLLFSGDLGRPGAPFLIGPEKISKADYLILESTYGDGYHEDIGDSGNLLRELVLDAVEKGGNVVIPAFAVGRIQDVLYELYPPAEGGKLEDIRCFVDSPMAASAGDIYSRHPECLNPETRHLLELGFDPLHFPRVRYTRSKGESKAISDLKEPHIIISASGMATGGRVLHHLIQNLECPECAVVFVGFQAMGTLGRRLLSKESSVRVLDKQIDVRARIESLHGFSAHADKGEILSWLRGFDEFPSKIFLNHGEPDSSRALAGAIREKFGAEVIIPGIGESYRLD